MTRKRVSRQRKDHSEYKSVHNGYKVSHCLKDVFFEVLPHA